MSIGLLDLNDSNLQLWHQDTRVQSPGYTLFQGGEYRFGAAARAAARLQPRDINTRFWWQLGTEALQPALGPARHTGDLVHAHLQQLHREAREPAEILLAVPGTMAHQQLALLLGIAQQCPFDAVGLVNRSVALGSLYSTGSRLFHLEIQLHQAVISELAERNREVELQRTVPLPGCGLLQLQERLVEIISAEFVRQTRFDPRRKATTEQQLYDVLPTALRALQNSAETNVDVNGYQARISAQQLQAAGRRLFDSASESVGSLHAGERVIADPLAALLPGLDTTFAQLQVLQSDDIRRALHAHQDRLIQREQALSFITALPCLIGDVADSAAASQANPPEPPVAPIVEVRASSRATHLLYRHVARPLQASGTALAGGGELYRSAAGWQLRGMNATVTVNGAAYEDGQILDSGDAIALAPGDTALLIEVKT